MNVLMPGAVLACVYVAGFLSLALIIRRTTPAALLDREAALAACVFWPACAVLYAFGFALLAVADLLWPKTSHNGGSAP